MTAQSIPSSELHAALPKVVISVLNWDGAAATLSCLASLKHLLSHSSGFMKAQVVVMDNGSSDEDWTALSDGIDRQWVTLLRQEVNLGFAGGHNVVIRKAMAAGADFVWLLNNDTLVPSDSLRILVAHMQEQPRCGAASPVIVALDDSKAMDFCGAMHDWKRLDSVRPSATALTAQLQASFPERMWLHGTAVLYRVQALAETGLFDEDMFAYFEDDDLGARLSGQGWASQVVFDCVIRHRTCVSWLDDRPAYYFYLMARNCIRFWLRHTPAPHRRLIRLRLVSRSLLTAAKLRERGWGDKSAACLMGAWDGLRGRYGPPKLAGRPPRWLVFASYAFPYRLQKLLG